MLSSAQVTRRTLASYCEGNVIDRATAPPDLLADLDLVVDGPYYDSRGIPDPRPGGLGTIAPAPHDMVRGCTNRPASCARRTLPTSGRGSEQHV